MLELKQKMKNDMELRGYSPRRIKTISIKLVALSQPLLITHYLYYSN